MHAYLIVGQTTDNLQQTTSDLAKKLGAKILEYPLQKIEDTRNLNNLIRLSFEEPTLIICSNIHEATEEALNAFLKNLEEPQDNIYFALTAPSARKVLPTIVSRCEIIKTMNNPLRGNNLQLTINNKETEKFLKLSVGEKLAYIDKICAPGGEKSREKAIEFAENTLLLLHSKLHEKEVKYKVVSENIETAAKALSGLKANGNVNLQLTRMSIELKN